MQTHRFPKLFASLIVLVIQVRVGVADPPTLNILLITVDDMNYDSPGAWEGLTPKIDGLAKEGLRFEHAHVTVALCQPCRSVLMTGRYPHRSGAVGFGANGEIDPLVPTLVEVLQGAGYHTGILGKYAHLKPDGKFPWDFYRLKADLGAGRDPDLYHLYASAFFEEASTESKPFFLMANSHDPHRPFKNPPDYSYAGNQIPLPGFLPDLPDDGGPYDNYIREDLERYYSSVHRADQTVGMILQALDESGLSDNTLVMFLSDHGMPFPFAKTNVYMNSTRTPWIVRWPGEIEAHTVDDQHMISGIDFMPTVLDAAGIAYPEGMDGRSFVPLFAIGGEQEDRDLVYTVFHMDKGDYESQMRSVQTKEFGYIYNQWSDGVRDFWSNTMNTPTWEAMLASNDDAVQARVNFYFRRTKQEFYDYVNDSSALNNLISGSDHGEVLRQLKIEMLTIMESTDDPLTEAFWQDANPAAARALIPPDGDPEADPEVFLAWAACMNAAKHTLYFGSNREDVESGVGDTQEFLAGNESYSVGDEGFGKTFYWRVDEHLTEDGPAIKGRVWSFTTAMTYDPAQAEVVSPEDQQTDVVTNVVLTWHPAPRADFYDVYLGDSEAAVAGADNSSPEFRSNQSETSYDHLVRLDTNTTYFWRVDTINHRIDGNGDPEWRFTTGDVWSLATAADHGPAKPVIVSPGDGDTGVFANVVLRWWPSEYATSYDVYFKEPGQSLTLVGYHVTETTFDPGTLVPYEATYHWRIDAVEFVSEELEYITIGDEWSFTSNDNYPGDLDGGEGKDCDGRDFLTFSACYNGSLNPPDASCQNLDADLDRDGDVDGQDFLTFSTCYNEPLNPPSCL